jgi:hypothetical protein
MFKKLVVERLFTLESQLTRIEGILSIMATAQINNQAQLDAAIAAVQASVTQLGADQTTAIAALLAKIATLPTGAGGSVDFTPEVTSLQAIATKLTSLDAAAAAANPPGTPTTGKGTGTGAIVANPAALTITGGASATATFSVTNAANPTATFTVVSSAPNIVTVAPANTAGSFTVTEASAGSATINVSDNATPPNTATVAVTAS